MLSLFDEEAQKLHFERLMEKAENHRKRNGFKPPRKPNRVFHILLARLGNVLFNWGCSLQARYGHILEPSSEPLPAFPRGNLLTESGPNGPPCS